MPRHGQPTDPALGMGRRLAAAAVLAAPAGIGLAAPAAACNGDSCQSTFPAGAQQAFEKFPYLQLPPSPIYPPVPVRQFDRFVNSCPPSPIVPPAPIRALVVLGART